MGAYHTLDLELHRQFQLHKLEWDVIAIERINVACDPAENADLGAVVMQEGIAHVCLINDSMTLVRAKIDLNIPRKRKGNCEQHEKGLTKFYAAVMAAVVRHFNFAKIKCIIIASPGFVKEQFHEYMFAEAVKNDMKVNAAIKN